LGTGCTSLLQCLGRLSLDTGQFLPETENVFDCSRHKSPQLALCINFLTYLHVSRDKSNLIMSAAHCVVEKASGWLCCSCWRTGFCRNWWRNGGTTKESALPKTARYNNYDIDFCHRLYICIVVFYLEVPRVTRAVYQIFS